MFRRIMLLAYGPARTGKSSFVNTIMKAEVTPVGSLCSEPTTLSLNSFEANLTSLPRNPASVTLFDVPGKCDCKMRMTNTEIKQRIEETVLSISDTDHLSAILIFESLLNQPTQLRSTLMDLEFTFGPEYRKSALVVLTKADRISDPEELAEAKRKAEDVCRQYSIPFIYLQNNYKDFALNDEQYNEQFDALMEKIKSLAPYFLREVQHYQRRINERARQFEETLHRNRRIVQGEDETEDVFTERVPFERTRVVYDVHERHQRGFPDLFGRRRGAEYYTENETKYHMGTVTRAMDQEMEVEYDASYYLNMAKEQVLEEIRNQYRRD